MTAADTQVTVTQADDVAKIAAGLTKAQRNVFEALGEPAFAGYVAVNDLMPLFQAGLIAVDDTPLGEQVRAYLIAQAAEPMDRDMIAQEVG